MGLKQISTADTSKADMLAFCEELRGLIENGEVDGIASVLILNDPPNDDAIVPRYIGRTRKRAEVIGLLFTLIMGEYEDMFG